MTVTWEREWPGPALCDSRTAEGDRPVHEARQLWELPNKNASHSLDLLLSHHDPVSQRSESRW